MSFPPPSRPSDRERLAAIALAGGRLTIGAGIWLAPRTTLRALGFGLPARPEELAIARIAGTRDLVLGAWQAGATRDREGLARATAAAAACDAGDVLTFALLLRAGRSRAGLRGVLGAGAAVGLGAALHRSVCGTRKSKLI